MKRFFAGFMIGVTIYGIIATVDLFLRY